MGHGFVLIVSGDGDENGGLLETLFATIPPEEDHRFQVLNLFDPEFPLAFNPLYDLMVARDAATSEEEREQYFNEALSLLTGLLQRIDPVRLRESVALQQYVQMACRLALKNASSKPGEIPTLLKVLRIFDQASRIIPEHSDLTRTEAQRQELSAFIRRMDMLFGNPIARHLFSIEESQINIREAIDQGLILVFVIPRRQLGHLAPMVEFLVLQSVVAASRHGGVAQGDTTSSTTGPIFIDEVRNFRKED